MQQHFENQQGARRIWESWDDLSFYGIPRWLSGKEYVCQCRRQKKHGFNPWIGNVPWRRVCPPTAVFLPGKFWAQKSLVGYSHGATDSDMTECVHTHTHTHTHTLFMMSLLLKKTHQVSSHARGSIPRGKPRCEEVNKTVSQNQLQINHLTKFMDTRRQIQWGH